MNLADVFNEFCTQLSARTGFLSEDNIRFYWFTAMLNQDNDLNHYSLEEPYFKLKGKELDLMYEGVVDGKEVILAIEIKFHRNPNNATFALPYSAGTLFDDIQRLPMWKSDKNLEVRYLFLYITDNEMHNYLSVNTLGYRSNLNAFYNAYTYTSTKPNLIDLQFIIGDEKKGCAPKTFFDNACDSCSINKINSNELEFKGLKLLSKNDDIQCKSPSLQQGQETNCHVRLYEISQRVEFK